MRVVIILVIAGMVAACATTFSPPDIDIRIHQSKTVVKQVVKKRME